MAEVYLQLGGNTGNVRKNFASAKRALKQADCSILLESSIYETEAWGKTDQKDFLNQVISVATEKSPLELLRLIREIENNHGRKRRQKWGPRTVDVDILLYEDLILNKRELTIPHPRLHVRNFVLIPLMEIAGDTIHPLLNKTIEELYLQSEDLSEVHLLDKRQDEEE